MKPRYILLLASALFGPACAHWQARYENTGDSPAKSIVSKQGPVREAIVEFSELGSYHDRSQIEQAVSLIQNTPRPLVVTYIHGWHHSSAEDDNDRRRFRDFLGRLAETRTVRGFDVVGIYIGWNGESWKIPWINSLTIWDRKAAAERLASNGDCLDALLRIGQATRLSKSSKHYNFYLGHSLGGLVLERAIAHTLLSADYNGGQLPWNLAVTLNSASDAVLTRQLMAYFQARYRYEDGKFIPRNGAGEVIPEQCPKIVSLTAENDRATGMLFPLGAAVSEVGHWRWPKVKIKGADGSEPILTEMKFHRRTPGHSRYLVNFTTEDLKAGPPNTDGPDNAFDRNLAGDIKDKSFWTNAPQNYPNLAQRDEQKKRSEPPPQEWMKWRFSAATGSDTTPGGPWNGPSVPYWNVRVNPRIIDNHGGIWSENTMAMLAAIFQMQVPYAKRDNPAPPSSPSSGRPLPPVETQRLLRESSSH